MQIVIGGKGGKLMGLCWTPAQLTDLDSFLEGDQVPLDLPLGTVPRPPHLEGEGVRAWEFHQMVVVEDKARPPLSDHAQDRETQWRIRTTGLAGV